MPSRQAANNLVEGSDQFGGNPGYNPNSLRARHLAWTYAGGSSAQKPEQYKQGWGTGEFWGGGTGGASSIAHVWLDFNAQTLKNIGLSGQEFGSLSPSNLNSVSAWQPDTYAGPKSANRTHYRFSGVDTTTYPSSSLPQFVLSATTSRGPNGEEYGHHAIAWPSGTGDANASAFLQFESINQEGFLNSHSSDTDNGFCIIAILGTSGTTGANHLKNVDKTVALLDSSLSGTNARNKMHFYLQPSANINYPAFQDGSSMPKATYLQNSSKSTSGILSSVGTAHLIGWNFVKSGDWASGAGGGEGAQVQYFDDNSILVESGTDFDASNVAGDLFFGDGETLYLGGFPKDTVIGGDGDHDRRMKSIYLYRLIIFDEPLNYSQRIAIVAGLKGQYGIP